MARRRKESARREVITTPRVGPGRIASPHHLPQRPATTPAAGSMVSIPGGGIWRQPLAPTGTATGTTGGLGAGLGVALLSRLDDLQGQAAEHAEEAVQLAWRIRLELHSLGAVDSPLIAEALSVAQRSQRLASEAHQAAEVAAEAVEASAGEAVAL